MSLRNATREDLKARIFELEDIILAHLEKEADIDVFLDNTTLLDEWEKVLPDQEYSIFILTILNNIRRDSIVSVIIDAVQGNVATEVKEAEDIQQISSVGKEYGHPFC